MTTETSTFDALKDWVSMIVPQPGTPGTAASSFELRRTFLRDSGCYVVDSELDAALEAAGIAPVAGTEADYEPAYVTSAQVPVDSTRPDLSYIRSAR